MRSSVLASRLRKRTNHVGRVYSATVIAYTIGFMRELVLSCNVDIAQWLAHKPSAAGVRPTHCPRCATPSRPVGERLRLVGHGCRPRTVRTPLVPEGPMHTVTISGRRYLCVCGATVVVVPRGVLPRRRYTAQAIARALAVAGGMRKSSGAECEQSGCTAPTLRRWYRAVERRELFAWGHLLPRTWSWRQRAHRLAAILAGYAYTSTQRVAQSEIGVAVVMGLPGSAGVFTPPPSMITSSPSLRPSVRDGAARLHRGWQSTRRPGCYAAAHTSQRLRRRTRSRPASHADDFHRRT